MSSNFGGNGNVRPRPNPRPTQAPRPTQTTATTPTVAPTQACQSSITIANNEPVRCAGSLIFEEQFNHGMSEKWKPDIRMPLDTDDAEFVLYHRYPTTWNVSNGMLHIFPKLITTLPEFSEDRLRAGEIDLGTEYDVI